MREKIQWKTKEIVQHKYFTFNLYENERVMKTFADQNGISIEIFFFANAAITVRVNFVQKNKTTSA